MSPSPSDRVRVKELLGREPQGQYEVVVRDPTGDPIVIKNTPLLDDGTPMPTLYWLIGRDEIKKIGRLEAAGGVRAAAAAIDPSVIASAHKRYAVERDASLPHDYSGPKPFGGVGGTRVGVKCLHAHWAWHLAGGDDPVGRWIAAELAGPHPIEVVLHDKSTVVTFHDGTTANVPWGPSNLSQRWLNERDPPQPEALTNALGTLDDHLSDIARDYPDFRHASIVALSGSPIAALAQVEVGKDAVTTPVELTRDACEEIFRMVATESSEDRAHNPGLPAHHVDTITASCCIVLAIMRRLKLQQVSLDPSGPS